MASTLSDKNGSGNNLPPVRRLVITCTITDILTIESKLIKKSNKKWI